MLTEVSAIVQYLAGQVPGKRLLPEVGSMERYHAVEWLSFVSAELLKSLGMLFVPAGTAVRA